MKIIKLESENIKRLYAVEIKPDGSLIVIGGRNAQGKTSLLDSIEMCLAGKSSIPKQPIRKGESKARVVIELDDLIVTRIFSTSDSKLVITDKQGFTKSSPQALLDSLTGKLSFDPLAFISMKPDEQLKIVKELAGIDFSKLDDEAKKIYDERTMVNREVKTLQAQVQAIEKYEDVPESELSITELVNKLEKINKINQKNQNERQLLSDLQNRVDSSESELDRLREEIKKLRERWDIATIENNRLKDELANQLFKVNDLQDEETDTLKKLIANCEETNRKVRSNLKYNELLFDFELRQQKVEKITKRLEEIEDEKLKLISSSKLPIQGLTFDSSTLYYNGVPFADQASSAEQLRVSVAMGFAMNPKLKILLIRDGSLLDEDNLKMIAEMAEKEGGQLWLERVGEGKECQVIIEDGRVKR